MTNGIVNTQNLPDLNYLPLSGGTLTGNLNATTITTTGAITLGSSTAANHAARVDWVQTGLDERSNRTLGNLSNAATARTNLGASTVGNSVFTASDAAAARSAIGAGTSSLTLGTTSTTALRGDIIGTGSGNVPSLDSNGRLAPDRLPRAVAHTQRDSATFGVCRYQLSGTTLTIWTS